MKISQPTKFALTALVFATYCSPSYAYLDPGTASMILQGAIAAIAGAFVAIKLYWYKIKSWFVKPDPKDKLDITEEGAGK